MIKKKFLKRTYAIGGSDKTLCENSDGGSVLSADETLREIDGRRPILLADETLRENGANISGRNRKYFSQSQE